MSSRAQAKEPRAAATPMATRPRILVTGESSARIRAVLRCLEGVRATLNGVKWQGYPESLEPGFAAVVIAEPLSVGMANAIAAVRGQPAGKLIALYALGEGNIPTQKARTAYLAGATAVIEWPREKTIFAGILTETMGMAIVRGPSTRADLALTRTARAHLRLGPRPGGSIRLSSRKGVVTASGEVRSLAELREIVETIAAVPGVKQVLTQGLRVAPSGIPDATVKRNIGAVMCATSEIDHGALLVSVRNGRVRLRGAVPGRAQFHDLLDRIATVKGVRDLDWEVDILGGTAASERDTARRLRKAILTLHPKEKIDVGFMAGVAVISGRVRSLVTKRAVARLVARDDGVSRVVNKLDVAAR